LHPPLSAELTKQVLKYLGVEIQPPSLKHVDELLEAYTQTVPWESAFRIAKRARTAASADCPRWPSEFWDDAINLGGGGTCFESNYAFFSLLLALGYDGYLTINNMGDSIGCHSAIVLNMEGQKWLVDVGIPIYAALPLDSTQVTQRKTNFHIYTIRADGENRFQIERDLHPKPNIFTLLDRPVTDYDYRVRIGEDYGENGLFLNRVIISKIIDNQQRRFDSSAVPPHFEVFENGQREDYPITIDVAEALGRHFDMDTDTIRAALAAVS
jgi:arylamine N-acetyltransferase